MSSSAVSQYVITFRYQEKGLSELLELGSAMVIAGFSTTLSDDEGRPHELGSNNFGIVSTLSVDELRQHAQGIGELVLEQQPEVEVRTLVEFNQQNQS